MGEPMRTRAGVIGKRCLLLALPIVAAVARPAMCTVVGSGYTFSTLATFPGNYLDVRLQTGLVSDAAGNLYGVTTGPPSGGAGNCGTVFEVPAGGGAPTTLVTFNVNNGQNPQQALIIDGN